MGKGKTKKGKPTVIGEEFAQLPTEPPCTCDHEPPRASDGHNVEGWTDEDVRVYNELLSERAKLEKEKNELEQKSARHHAERALLNEDAAALDNLFKVQLGGEYKFTGTGSCCLDIASDTSTSAQFAAFNAICKHEICLRAKTGGISWMEMDTIKYYQARISSEKSQRMQNALRKQRDVELARVKKDDDEDNASRARKSAIFDKSMSIAKEDTAAPMSPHSSNDVAGSLLEAFSAKGALFDPKNTNILEAAKENEQVVRQIRTRLDKIRHDVNAGRVTPFDARVKLEQANKEMAEAERKNNAFREMIWTTAEPGRDSAPNPTNLSHALSKTLASSNGDAFSQALSVMKGFFSASDPRDVQAAITDLRSVLETNGPMSPVLQKSFQALEDMLAKPNAKGFSVDLMNSDGTTRTCTNVVDVLLSLRQNGRDPTSLGATAEELKLDKATMESNQECAAIEAAACKEMEAEIAKLGECDGKTRYEALKKIKAKAVIKSPIPPLSDIVLDGAMNEFIYKETAQFLAARARQGATQQDLAAQVTSTVITTSERKPERYIEILAGLSKAIEKIPFEANLQALDQAVANVQGSMQKFVAKHQEKKAKDAAELERVALSTRALENIGPVVTARSSKPSIMANLDTDSDNLFPDPLHLRKSDSASKPTTLAETKELIAASEELTKTVEALRKEATGNPMSEQEFQAKLHDALNRPGGAEELLGGMGLEDMTRWLQGMDPTEMLEVLCGLEPGADPKSQSHANTRLKTDLERFIAMPTGKEDPKLLRSVQSQIQSLAKKSAQAHRRRAGQTPRGKVSKFLEQLQPEDSAPPPYKSNPERSRHIKVKHVQVNTPQIRNGKARQMEANTMPDVGRYEDKATQMTDDLAMFRDALGNFIKVPTPEGTRARYMRRELNWLTRDMRHLISRGYREQELAEEDEVLDEEDLGAPEEKGKGKARAVDEPSAMIEELLASTLLEPATVDTTTTTDNDGAPAAAKKKTRKRRGKKPAAQAAPESDSMATTAGQTDPEAESATAATVEGHSSSPTPVAVPPTGSSEPSSIVPPLSYREKVIKRQLSNFALYIDNLTHNRAMYQPDPYGFRETFDGIFAQLAEQMCGHIEMAWHLSTANNWVGLQHWLTAEFGEEEEEAEEDTA